MSANSIHFSEKSEDDDELQSSAFERFQQGMKADFSKLIDEVQHFPQQQKRNNTLKPETRQTENDLEQPKEEETDDVWTDDIASSVETGMPHPEIDGISFHSDIDIYGDLVDGEDRSSSDSWERHLNDVDDDYKLRPPRKKTSGSVISVQSVGNYFLSRSFPVSEFDDVLNSQRTTESNSIDDDVSEANELLSYQALLQSRFPQLPTKFNEKTEYNIQEASFQDEHISQHDNSLSSPENISISEAISPPDPSPPPSPSPPPQKEFKYAISPESFLFECRSTNGKLTTKKKVNLNIYNPSSAVAIQYRLDSLNDLLLFSSLSSSVPEQSQKLISVRLNTDTISQLYAEELQSLSDKLLVFIDDLPPSVLEVIISMDPDIDLSVVKPNTEFIKEQHDATYDSCCKLCNIENVA